MNEKCDIPLGRNGSLIRYEDIFMSFEHKDVLKGVDLSVYPGDVLVIIGGSGSGKSVMLKLLIGLLEPDTGNIFFGNDNVVEILENDLMEIRRKIAMLFQSSALFDSMTVYENIAYPLREHMRLEEDVIKQKVKEKLALVDLFNIEHLYPAELSGGMKKRVALARAIATDPCVILYDEPTTGLDPSTSNVINNLIVNLQKKLGVTSIVVTHDMNSVRMIASRIAFLYKGKIVADGKAEDILDSKIELVRDFIDGHISHAT
jgi:phospholipid/cholesterol/gamma-HCH transport system ATP-binding protein